MPKADANRKSGRRSHPFGVVQRPIARYKTEATAFGRAVKILAIDSDKKLADMLGNRVVPGTIRAWRNGQLTAPLWAVETICKQTTAASAALDQAKKEAAEAAS